MQTILEREGLERAINFVGGYNYYQVRSLIILVMQHIFRSFFIMYYPFLNQAPIFLCKDPHNPDNVYDCSENAGGCVDQVLSPNSPQSLVVELGLYCEKSYVRTIAGLMFFVSQNIGSAYFCYVSDKSGRRASLLYSYLLYGIALLLLGFGSVGPVTYIVFLMLVRGVSSSYSSISLTYLTEIGNQEFAKKATLIVLVGQTMAAISVVVLAFFVTSWKTMLIYGIALPAILVCYSFRMLYETPEFHLVNKDMKGAVNVLSSIAEINNIAIKSSSFFSPKKNTNKNSVNEALINKDSRSWNYYEIMMNAELRKRVIPYSVIKLYLYMAFYGSLFAVSSLGGSIHINLIVAGIAELIGYLLSIKAPEYSYYKLLQVSLKITSATGIGFLLIPSLSCETSFVCSPLVIQGFLALILRASICFIYGFIYGLGNEMFPTEVRSQSIGISDIFSAVGGMFCPFIIMIADKNNLNPLFLFGILGMVALYANQFLPDVKEPIPGFTDEKDLKQDIEMSYIKMKDLESNK